LKLTSYIYILFFMTSKEAVTFVMEIKTREKTGHVALPSFRLFTTKSASNIQPEAFMHLPSWQH